MTVVVFGGSSGIGEATADAAKRAGARVIVVGRDRGKLDAVASRIGGIETAVADATDRAAVARVFADAGGAIDHVVVSISGGKGGGPFKDLDLDGLHGAFVQKTLAQLGVTQVAARHVRPGGSITLVTAASARSRIRGTAGLAAVNGALEAAVPILALELAPIRVNAVSPGIIDTAWWSGMPAAAKDAYFRKVEQINPVGRVGRAEDVARAILMLMQNDFVTGSIYEVDGGGHLVTQ